ncbi:O-succinylbenzoic acid--CoA ligase [Yeosuana aromativorans]|uniref:O-succinylbenzoic acid--CoA ligase n=1 Tax=Yeosuana aromativorans TaxID=288019 RepID=A0A8J3BTJ4_9FLAO|nr:AMP-binding protein [Yeosuana aromativorans]GGK34655.1 O-succinylbenzoic acid--CoA ligase [Yeosuana aromativorans]
MIPTYNKVHLKFKLNGVNYDQEHIREIAYSFVKEGLPYEEAIGDFLLDWLDNKTFIKVKSTGTTGKPKQVKIDKQVMVNSSIFTGNFFNLKPGDKALHCLPANFIAGKMMLVRAMILGLELDLTEPTSKPVFDTNKQYDFAAMLPIQLQNTLEEVRNFKNIIIGSVKASNKLIEDLQDLPVHVFETFGMTETATHIALRPLNNFENGQKMTALGKSIFKTLPDISISQDDRGCLVVESGHLSKTPIVTNDLVKLYSEDEFEWLGRFDNVINSGGVKIFPETIEEKLQGKIKQRFFIASEKDETFGEKIILILEGDIDTIDKSVFKVLDKYEKPKKIYCTKKFDIISDKIQRKKILNKLAIV